TPAGTWARAVGIRSARVRQAGDPARADAIVRSAAAERTQPAGRSAFRGTCPGAAARQARRAGHPRDRLPDRWPYQARLEPRAGAGGLARGLVRRLAGRFVGVR